jgi:cytidylate kinase
MSKRIIVAIDGPAGAGKSTIARRVAAKLDFVYIDTGAMYRAIALWALRRDVDTSDMHRLEQLANEASIAFEPGESRVLLNGEDVSEAIRAPVVTEAASKISAISGVRRALVEKQRAMGENGSVVMEGRDIGTVVFPDAQVKIYLDADTAVRAGRRARELDRPRAEVARDLAVRDNRDRARKDSPLQQSPDAIYVDTSGLDLDEVEELVLKLIRDRTSNGKEYAR